MIRAVKRLLLAMFVVILFASTLYLESNIPETKAAASPPNYQLYSDGGGSTSSIHWDGTKFTLTENIEGTITIMSNDTVLDGAGFTVRGRGDSVGITVYDKTGVTIRNVKVENFGIGILLGHYSPDAFLWYDPNPNRCTNCTVSNCQMSNNTLGLSIVGGIWCRITGNQVTNGTKGIMFSGSGNVFRSNHMANNNVNFDDLAGEKSDVDTSNTVDGKPICYLVDQKNLTVPADAGLVHLEGCQNIAIKEVDIQHASKAIALFNSSNCKISQNTVANGETGISLHDSHNNTITQNELLNNSADGIEQSDSENTTITHNLIRGNGGGVDSGGYSATGSRNANISGNQITGNSGCGIQAGTACTISGNYIEGNGQHGIYFWDISNSVVSRNTITKNSDCGVSFRTGKYAFVTGNDISRNNVGIEMGDLTGTIYECVLTENNFSKNTNLAIRVNGDLKDSSVYFNNFAENNNGSIQVTIKGRFVWHGDEGYDENSKVFPQYVASQNSWDNGSVGNYWSDYNQTAGDTYKIDKNNQDRHPQAAQFQFAQLEMPQVGSKTPQPSLPIFEQLSGIAAALAALAIAIVATAILYKKRIKKQVGS